jgi:hypothetical protein
MLLVLTALTLVGSGVRWHARDAVFGGILLLFILGLFHLALGLWASRDAGKE